MSTNRSENKGVGAGEDNGKKLGKDVEPGTAWLAAAFLLFLLFWLTTTPEVTAPEITPATVTAIATCTRVDDAIALVTEATKPADAAPPAAPAMAAPAAPAAAVAADPAAPAAFVAA